MLLSLDDADCVGTFHNFHSFSFNFDICSPLRARAFYYMLRFSMPRQAEHTERFASFIFLNVKKSQCLRTGFSMNTSLYYLYTAL